MLKDVDFLKGLTGVLFGAVLAALTVTLNSFLIHPYSDVVLLILYVINYFPASLIANAVSRSNTWRKGVSMFFAFQFLSWVAAYEVLYSLTA